MKLLALLLTFLSACSLDTAGLTSTPVAPSLRGSVDSGINPVDVSGSGGGPDTGFTPVADAHAAEADVSTSDASGSELNPGADAGSSLPDTSLSPECPIDGLRSLNWCDRYTQLCHYPSGPMVGCTAEGRLCVVVCP